MLRYYELGSYKISTFLVQSAKTQVIYIYILHELNNSTIDCKKAHVARTPHLYLTPIDH